MQRILFDQIKFGFNCLFLNFIAVTPCLASMTFNYVSFNILYGLMLACRQLIFFLLNIKLN